MRSRLLSAAGTAAGAILLFTSPTPAQQGGGTPEKLAAVKQAAAANQQALRQYRWTEMIQVSVNGEVKANRQMACQYGADGKPACTPMGPPPQQEQARGIRGRVAEHKKEDMQDYMQQVKAVIGMYVPPEATRMQNAFQAGNTSIAPMPGSGEAGLAFKNYAQPGDAMSLDFRMATKKLAGISVNTYVGDPSSPVSMTVQFAQLPDGTNYPSQIVVNAAAKGIQVTQSNVNYVRLGG
jgi:hypothetical protein